MHTDDEVRSRKQAKVCVQVQAMHSSYDRLRAAWREVDRLGFDSLWVPDHFFPWAGDEKGTNLEAWTLLAAMGAETSTPTLGTLVSAYAYRNADLMAETERENIRESTLEGLETAARKGKHGGRPPVITDDMLHTVLRRRAKGESVEQIQPDMIIPTGKRKGQSPSVASIYRALAEHAKLEAYPEAIEAAHADFGALQNSEVPGARPCRS
ncbi:hypothetical protein MCAG_00115 [Micromonospora sp. ATCC 39149]|uniref:LLM class flavin-dependent oxidoreductase n=1 Tax=Micromonospora carbonacea TaxID=47853 RepID=A0A7D5Y697_9ACTN|nr:LLM class flavin-dependent oxidoreductase [Micromonospora sp. ATCC 39149]EEP69788.1 hypothetical protein MCAG_00115 [Micromonospora sp. ATCC 39149]QLJ96261.1 LLM class flavin-dependent oxidoreductase [Micromonospora carbonacea]